MVQAARPFLEFQRLDALQLPLPDLMRELQRHLDRCIGLDSLVVHWYDEQAGMNEFYADPGWNAEAIEAYVADNRHAQAVHRRIALQRLQARQVYGLDEQVLRGREVYDTVVRPLGLGAVLSLPYWQPGLRAIVSCVRSASGPHKGRFAPADLRQAERLQGALGGLLAREAGPPAPALVQPGAALMVLDADGRLLQACARGRRLLALLEASPAGADFQARLQQALGRLETTADATEFDLSLSDGRYRLRLRPLGALGTARPWVAVEWDRLSHPELKLLTLAREASLSRRELQVAQALLGSASVEAIARQLGVAESTLKTLSRSLYQRLQVSDRQGLWRKFAAA
ncbi:helix-turn-helix transcriptional regulator [Inhella proteolytica]|uniref:Helix-turn-helix transcriptional regulator n=1 Tax=Inhella proteolytica TaxID=2795029 RepID=A0A931NGE1_9BURK|nr:helix-turn-helix transcriptional regulator [Inhella proteolytica]MBH9577051.1 helix-turn-helix transcriptional regulator [Inhella proteolytica]